MFDFEHREEADATVLGASLDVVSGRHWPLQQRRLVGGDDDGERETRAMRGASESEPAANGQI